MHSFTPIIFSTILISFLAGVYLLALRFLNRPWWVSRKVRWLGFALPLAGIFWSAAWWLAANFGLIWLKNLSMIFVGAVMVFELTLVFTLPLSSLIRYVVGRIARLVPPVRSFGAAANSDLIDPGRRKALGALVAAVPIGTLAMGAGGFGGALAGAKVYERKIAIESLPDDLKGLKIFHLSDLHLGPFVKLDDLEEVVAEAEKFQPDLVLITGDIADEVPLLADALKLIDQLRPRLGSFASLGNHEHFRGVKRIRKIIDRSPVSLLVDEGVTMTVGTAPLCLTAIDDPRRMGGDHTLFFRQALDRAMLASRSDDTVILMSHRPSVFDLASEIGVDLTLAGHTHGGQVGLAGRSLFEAYASESYLWGHYTRGKSQLYTSAGMGHWFPFRMGCPTEAPIITLG